MAGFLYTKTGSCGTARPPIPASASYLSVATSAAASAAPPLAAHAPVFKPTVFHFPALTEDTNRAGEDDGEEEEVTSPSPSKVHEPEPRIELPTFEDAPMIEAPTMFPFEPCAMLFRDMPLCNPIF